MGPRVLGLAAVQLNFLVNANVASWLGEGAVSALNYAWLLMLLPQGVFAQSVATAAFPTFAEQSARHARDELRHTLSSTLRVIMFVTIPAAAGLILLGHPLVALLLQRGAFQAASTAAVTWALYFYALGLVGHAGVEIVVRAFYALHDTWTPVWVGGLAMGVNVTLSLVLPSAFAWGGLAPHGGLALASSVAVLLELGGLLFLLRRQLGGLEMASLWGSLGRAGVATVAMGGALLLWRRVLGNASPLLLGGGGVLLGGAVYLAVAALCRAEELREVRRMVRRS